MVARVNFRLWMLPAICAAGLACQAQVARADPPLVKVGSRAELTEHVGGVVIVEGYFYDGSIPMLVSDMEYVRADTPMPEDVYIAIVGPLPGDLEWGELVRVKGTVREPDKDDPPAVRGESLVLAVSDPADVAIVDRPRP